MIGLDLRLRRMRFLSSTMMLQLCTPPELEPLANHEALAGELELPHVAQARKRVNEGVGLLAVVERHAQLLHLRHGGAQRRQRRCHGARAQQAQQLERWPLGGARSRMAPGAMAGSGCRCAGRRHAATLASRPLRSSTLPRRRWWWSATSKVRGPPLRPQSMATCVSVAAWRCSSTCTLGHLYLGRVGGEVGIDTGEVLRGDGIRSRTSSGMRPGSRISSIKRR